MRAVARRMLGALAGAAALAIVAGCETTPSAQAKTGPSATSHHEAASASGMPDVSVQLRAAVVAGRPVPYRLLITNESSDVIVPISAEAKEGKGLARFSRAVAGEVSYDAASDRYLENPLLRATAERVLFRAAVFPGESLVQDLDVRYPRSGEVSETVRVLYHRLSRSEFESSVYVDAGGAVPRRYSPVGLLSDKVAREGALLAGFLVRTDRDPEAITGTIQIDLPAVPAAIAAKIQAAGLEPDDVLSASWAGGWIAGDADRSLLVTGDSVRALPGVPFPVVQRIDVVEGAVPFCITGATRDQIAPLFAGYEIIPHECLHVSVPRDAILRTLEKIGGAGWSVELSNAHLREALDLVKRAPLPAPTGTAGAGTPSERPRTASAGPKPKKRPVTPSESATATPAATERPATPEVTATPAATTPAGPPPTTAATPAAPPQPAESPS